MASIDYPSTLPKALPVSGKPDNGDIRTQMDVGPAKVRRRTTATAKPMSFSIRITGALFNTLRTFFHTTALEGSLPFNMDDPWNDSSAEWRFTDTYDWNLITGAEDPDDRIYEITLYMEKLP